MKLLAIQTSQVLLIMDMFTNGTMVDAVWLAQGDWKRSHRSH